MGEEHHPPVERIQEVFAGEAGVVEEPGVFQLLGIEVDPGGVHDHHADIPAPVGRVIVRLVLEGVVDNEPGGHIIDVVLLDPGVAARRPGHGQGDREGSGRPEDMLRIPLRAGHPVAEVPVPGGDFARTLILEPDQGLGGTVKGVRHELGLQGGRSVNGDELFPGLR